MKNETETQSEFRKFDPAVGKALSVSREELRRREEQWKKQSKRKKLAKATHEC
jgi:hypothetical protein